MNKIKSNLSKLVILLIVICCLAIDCNLKSWKKTDRVIEWDVHWYYAYLPALFVYNDIKLEKSNYKVGKEYYFWPSIAPNNGKFIKSTMGIAFFYAPFFFVAHSLSFIFNLDKSGFSEHYKFFLLLSTIFYLAVGLFYLRKILKKYFSEEVTAITLLLLGLGTNLLAYSSQSAPMPHTYNFAAIAMFIYYSIKWYEKQNIKNTIIIGFLLGIISLIRPTNMLIILVFVLYGITNLRTFSDRFIFLISKYKLIILMVLCFIIIWIPQLVYWKIVTDQYIFYSYGDEHFFFNDPKLFEGLIGFRKGWLIYTPIMFFSLTGFLFLKKELKKFRLAIITFTVINIYIIFSWWCWWYGGSFGQRPMIDSYALLAIPLASFVSFMQSKKYIFKILFYSICLFFIWLNIFNTFQFERASIHYCGMTKTLYFKQFGKLNPIKDFGNYISWPNDEKAKKNEKWEN